MKTPGRKSEVGELDINAMQEDFGDNGKLALDYLNCKFGEEIIEEIKNAVAQSLSDNS